MTYRTVRFIMYVLNEYIVLWLFSRVLILLENVPGRIGCAGFSNHKSVGFISLIEENKALAFQ